MGKRMSSPMFGNMMCVILASSAISLMSSQSPASVHVYQAPLSPWSVGRARAITASSCLRIFTPTSSMSLQLSWRAYYAVSGLSVQQDVVCSLEAFVLHVQLKAF